MIRDFVPADEQGVIDLILPIQRSEFGIAISIEDQPDLRMIPAFYQTGAGGFLVAEVTGKIVGTIALKDAGDGIGALRKMFVAAGFRGRDHGVAQALLTEMLARARRHRVREIILGTADVLHAAHRFYERNGFVRIDPDRLPAAFPRMAVDTRFYRLALTGRNRAAGPRRDDGEAREF